MSMTLETYPLLRREFVRPEIRDHDQETHRHPSEDPGAKTEIRWCPSHQGIEGNEVADEWAKLAADEPDAHGVEWFTFRDPNGQARKRKLPLLRSLAPQIPPQ